MDVPKHTFFLILSRHALNQIHRARLGLILYKLAQAGYYIFFHKPKTLNFPAMAREPDERTDSKLSTLNFSSDSSSYTTPRTFSSPRGVLFLV